MGEGPLPYSLQAYTLLPGTRQGRTGAGHCRNHRRSGQGRMAALEAPATGDIALSAEMIILDRGLLFV